MPERSPGAGLSAKEATRVCTTAAVTAAVVCLTLAAVRHADATVPGANGLIAFTSDRDGNNEIYVMNPDGSGQINLTRNAATDQLPAWSPDGTRIAFQRQTGPTSDSREIYVMNADGSTQTNLTNNGVLDQQPAWSPDGTKIAFATYRDGNNEVYVMNPDGSNPVDLTQNPANDQDPAWSPDGTKIAFRTSRDGNEEIYVMNANGGSQTDLTNSMSTSDLQPDWSPDGTRIAFQRNQDIYVMNADGSVQTPLTSGPASDQFPAWSPDGTKIAFNRSEGGGNPDVFAIGVDGNGLVDLSNNSASDFSPRWQSLLEPPSNTAIIKAKINRNRHRAAFRFSASGTVTGFQCKLIRPRGKHHRRPKATFVTCRSPKTYKHLRRGRYTFKVKAFNSAGSDPRPAIRKFRI